MLVGVVGKSNSGKSTFFKALTLQDVEVGNRVFVTIKPNQGVAFVTAECPCKKLDVKCKPQNSKCVRGTRLIPVKLLDVAGLIPGAHQGKGLGNQFLDDLRQADALVHVLDASGMTDEKGEFSEEGGHDPEKDIGMLEGEIDHWVFGIIEKNIEKLQRTAAAEKIPMERLIAKQLSGLGVQEEDVGQALKIHQLGTLEFAAALRKPILIAANKADLMEAQKNIKRLQETHELVPCSAESELALREAERKGLIEYIPGDGDFAVKDGVSEEQKRALEFIKKVVMVPFGSTGVQRALNNAVFGLLGLIAVYPVASISKLADSKGNVLPDAFLVREGTTLKEFASKVHKDIGEGFIGGLDLKKMKIGADYQLRNGDVVEILFKK
ncbi:MAG: redox-regulated ATPase YchF [Candidatus Aenigmarchaeota archaeon]|nr:redox-regulated ATPase YchF [Candidatus Aenigmarchaeota archaeon]